MNKYLYNLQVAFITVLALLSTLSTKISEYEFEIVLVAGFFIAIFILFFDILTISRVVYIIVNRKKRYNVIKTKKKKYKKGSKKIFIRVKDFLLKNITSQFRFKLFRRKLTRKINVDIWKLHIKIPYFILWILKILVFNAFAAIFLFNGYRKQFTTYPNYYAAFPKEGEVWNDYQRPIEISFSVPVDKESLIINMAPENSGDWVFEKSFSFLPFTRRIKYYPNETIYPDQDIMIYLTDLTNHFHTMDGGEHLIRFHSISLPDIVSTQPENEATDIPIDQDIVINLNQKDGTYVGWEFDFNIETKYSLIRDNDKFVVIALNESLKQGQSYEIDIYQVPLSSNIETLEVIKRGDKENIGKLTFTTVTAPMVESFEPTGSTVMPDSQIRIVFDNDMNKESVESAFSINPETEGEITWEDDRTFIFTPSENFPKETHYNVTLKQGMESKVGGVSEEDIVYSFDTIGAVRVIGWSPGYGATSARVTSSINVIFDQAVDHTSAQESFSMSPTASGNFSWNGNTMIFTPSASLEYSTQYTVTIQSGVKTVYGYDSRQSFSSVFTTETNIFVLNVPLYRQTHAFTCNITAVAMALSYSGVPSSEMSVYNAVPKDNTPCTKVGTDIIIWGNPHVGYVGNIDGAGECGGYGIYWEVASSYMSSVGVSNRIYTGWNVADLAHEVQNGHPAVIWWQNGWASPFDKSWNTPDGQYIRAINGMHSEVVVGFIGPADNPTHIITNDPWRGRRTLNVAYFNSLWGYFNRTAVVVY